MADNRCYKNFTVNGDWQLGVVEHTICPGTQGDDGFSRCCGPSAICLPNNICQALNAAEGSTGFYVGSCTDRDFQSSVCSNFCSQIASPNIVYNENQDKWHCCGLLANGTAKCDRPTTRTSKAPAPSVLLEEYTASVATFTASSTSSSTTASMSTPTASTTPEEDSGGLSTGAKVGAGIGGAIGGLLVIALIVFLLRRRRTSKSTQHPYEQQPDGVESYDMTKQNSSRPATSQPPAYQTPIKSPAELSPSPVRAELPGSGQRGAQSPQELPS